MKDIMRWLPLAILIAGIVTVTQCKNDEKKSTGILLTITVKDYTGPLTRVEILARDIDYDKSMISQELNDRDLATSPLEIFVSESSLTTDSATGAPLKFLVLARGFNGNQQVAAAAKLLLMEKDKVLTAEIDMRPDYVDADGDGFAACNPVGCDCNTQPDSDCCNPGCDCNDQNSQINPFTVEKCDDHVDNNCSGLPVDEGCGCSPDGATRACTTMNFVDNPDVRPMVGVGACKFGTQTCSSGVWQADCVGAGTPKAQEIPDNGIDDDCDGAVDEGSSCSNPGGTRDCLLGRVDISTLPADKQAGAAAYDIEEFAHDSPGVRCLAGKQTCNASNHWENVCNGEVRPQRDPSWIGFVELPAGSTEGAETPPAGSCQGNDCWWRPQMGQCDGVDNDCDGRFDEEPWFDADGDGYTYCGTSIIPGGDPKKPEDKRPGLYGEFIDCDDSNPQINPSAVEICGNDIDEDCRCNHDSQGRPAGSAGSEIGRPYNNVFDFATGAASGTVCSLSYAHLDCSRPGPRSDPTTVGACSDSPDPYFYGYYLDTTAGSCFLCADGFGSTCDTTDPSRCTTKAEDCNPCATRGAEAQHRPLCSVSNPLQCLADIPLTAWVHPNGQDPNSECPTQTCNDSQPSNGGGPFFFGLDKTNPAAPRCHYVADVSGMCDGNGACMTRQSECLASGSGGEEPNRPRCMTPLDGSCIGATAPNYGGFVPANTDPYTECPGTCDGNGECFAQFGEACGGTKGCESPYHCVDGVCCENDCADMCKACSSALTGGISGNCLPIANQVSDTQPSVLCANTVGCTGIGSHCVCEPGMAECRRDNGDLCTTSADCAANACRTDWDGAGQFCAESITSCVFDAGAARLQVANAQTRCAGADPTLTTRTCNNGIWGADVACGNYVCNGTTSCFSACTTNDDAKCIATDHCVNASNTCVGDFGATAVCQEDSDCTSGHCRAVWSGGTSRCAPNATSCVLDNGTQVASGTAQCGGADPSFNTKTCTNGIWGGQTNCGAYVCNGTAGCLTDCTSNDDAKCITADHCVNASNTCVGDLGAGTSCQEDSDCTSTHCRTAWGGGSKLCAQDASSCVFDDGSQIANTGTRCSGTDPSFSTKTCTAGVWTSQVNCGTYKCNGTTSCYANCDTNDDAKCVKDTYCDEAQNPDACVGQLAAGSGCNGNSDCLSNACRTDWDGSGLFCAQDGTSCVFDTGSGVTQHSNAQTRCSGADPTFTTKTCSSGIWSSPSNCSGYVCNGTTSCYTDCSSNQDSKCIIADHCDGTNHCIADFASGTACTEPSDCSSNYCRTDWDGSGTFCAQDSLSCVYDTGSSRNQYNNGSSLCTGSDPNFNTKTCTAGGWISQASCAPYVCNSTQTACYGDCSGNDDLKCIQADHCGTGSVCLADLAAGAACVEGSDCASGYCRSDYDASGTFCADDATSCVAAGTNATATDVNTTVANCYNGDRYLCSNGSWSSTDCLLYECNAGTCYTNCESNRDDRCVSAAHCDTVAGTNNDVCSADLPAGVSCLEDSDCVSGHCRDDWDSIGRFCADDATSCVAAGTNSTATDVNTGDASCNNGGSYVCNTGVWVFTNCGLYVCNAGACYTNCESNNDTLCVAAAHCEVVSGSNNDACAADIGAGQPCAENSDCTSGYCRTDWDGIGTFCADDATSCVAAGAGTTATDVNTAVANCYNGDSYLCTAGTWSASDCLLYSCTVGVCNTTCESNNDSLCIAAAHCDAVAGPTNDVCTLDITAGQPCVEDSDCTSGYCRTDWDNTGTFCADDATSCVAAGASTTATDVNTAVAICYDGDRYLCTNGVWSATDCGTYNCNAGTCYPDCSGDLDARCATNYHCLAADIHCYTGANGQPCDVDAECTSVQCECTNATCTTRVCVAAAANCVCGWEASGGCTTKMNLGDNDPQDCKGSIGCTGSNCVCDGVAAAASSCKKGNNDACGAPGDCASNNCSGSSKCVGP